MKEGERLGRWEGEKEPGQSFEFGIREHRALGGAQSVQKVEDKRITTERHGAARKGTVYKFVASVKFREDPW
jgi:hypothetical protein